MGQGIGSVNAMSECEGKYWSSKDGLKLHYRDYAGGVPGQPVMLCMPGLTRNARDFEPLADQFAGEWRVICVDFRGRGGSEYAKDSATYNPMQYAEDVEQLLAEQELGEVVLVGTSLGGIVTSLLAARGVATIKAAVINDIGPEINAGGVARIRDYVGHGRNYPTWMHAARALMELQGPLFPHFEINDWLRFAKRAMAVGSNGRIVLDYDMRIAEPFNAPEGDSGGADLWPAFKALSGRPVLLLRGATSDLLTKETAAKMTKQIDGLQLVEVPGVGHAPTLEEEVVQTALATFLSNLK